MKALFPVVLAASLWACSPTLNWREVQAEGLVGLLPCRPSAQTRRVPLGGTEVPMTLHACEAGGATWALGSADLGQPERVAPALDEMARAAQRNIAAREPGASPLAVPGAAGPAGRRLRMAGQRPDGSALRLEMVVFSRGTRVYQASVLGPALGEDALDTFFGALRLVP